MLAYLLTHQNFVGKQIRWINLQSNGAKFKEALDFWYCERNSGDIPSWNKAKQSQNYCSSHRIKHTVFLW
jgi:hypothetical protein